MLLFAYLQCWDEESARHCARVYANAGFEGIAIGGMVPRAKDKEYIKNTVRAVHEEAPDCIIHVFGCGNPNIIPELIDAGADSFDSSSYVRTTLTTSNEKATYALHSNLHKAICKILKINALIGKTESCYERIPNMKLLL